MALFRNRPQVSDSINYVSVGQNKTLLIVGLGNTGREYEGTRHNIGFAVVDKFVQKTSGFDSWQEKKDLKCLLTSGRVAESRLIIIKPTTMMNNSGEAVQAAINFYKIPLAQILVVHDELDIDFGQIRTRIGGESAGHNGIKSVIQHCGKDFGRFRIGIGPRPGSPRKEDFSRGGKKPDQIDSADFVLAKFSKTEQEQMNYLLQESTAMLSEYIYGGGKLEPETRSFIV